MKSSASYWIVVALVGALTLLPKLSRDARTPTAVAHVATEQLRQFLTPLSPAPLEKVQQKPPIDDWSGWRFTAGGCSAIAFPSGLGSELTAAARLHARASDRVEFIYRGEVLQKPPTMHIALDYMATRMTFRPWPFYVVLVRPAGCTAPLKLPWAKLS